MGVRKGEWEWKWVHVLEDLGKKETRERGKTIHSPFKINLAQRIKDMFLFSSAKKGRGGCFQKKRKRKGKNPRNPLKRRKEGERKYDSAGLISRS